MVGIRRKREKINDFVFMISSFQNKQLVIITDRRPNKQ
jgi:hypothetical protein